MVSAPFLSILISFVAYLMVVLLAPNLCQNLEMVAAVHDLLDDNSSTSFEMHLEPWIGV
jgi:hypothetical protein